MFIPFLYNLLFSLWLFCLVEDPLEKEMAIHFIILAGKSHGQRSLAGNSPQGRKELGPTERITLSLSLCLLKLGSQFLPNKGHIHYICWIIKKAREFQKNIYFCFIDYTKAFDCVDHNKLWKILKEMGIPDHLICLLRNLYAGQETMVRTWNNRLVPNQEKRTSRLCIVTLLI